MKKFLLIPLLLFAVTAAAAWARPFGPPQPDFSALYEQWQLSEEQIAALKEIFQKHHEAIRALHDEEFTSRAERHDAMDALRQEHEIDLAAVLTEEQIREMFEFIRQNAPPRRGHGPRPRTDESSEQS